MPFVVPIYGRYDDDILIDATVTSNHDPLTTYSLLTLRSHNPSARVVFGVKTLTVTFTVTSALGDILCIPMHNLDAGSSVLTLTNGAGFSHAITIPPYQADGFPPTLMVDLTAYAGTRTSTTWNLVISGNTNNVVLGGAVMIYGPKRSFAGVTNHDSISWQFKEHETGNNIKTPNEYKTPYTQDYGTVSRSTEFVVHAPLAGALTLRDWHRVSHGGAKPIPFWYDPTDLTVGYFGLLPDTFTIEPALQGNYKLVNFTFEHWPKGKVIV